MIITDFLTTVSGKQALNSLKAVIFGFSNLRFGKQNDLLIQELHQYYGDPYIITTHYNARSALSQYLQSQKWDGDAEVIISGYNCVSVSNAVIQSGYMPIYCDIENHTFSIDYSEFERKINKKTKAIILQHTFGVVAKHTDKIITQAKKEGILVIEDVAHTLGATFKGKKSGTLGDAAIFSTGRDKVISSVNGAWLIERKIKKTKNYPQIIPSKSMVLKNHLYNIIGYISQKTYNFLKIGRICMMLSKKMHIFPDILSKSELNSSDSNLNYALPNSLAFLLRNEFQKIDEYSSIRKKYCKIYQKGLKFGQLFQNYEKGNAFRTVFLCKNSQEQKKLIQHCKQKGILLGTSWSNKNIAPIGTDLEKAKYTLTSCKNAENIACRIVFLPNGYNNTQKEVTKVIKEINHYYTTCTHSKK